MCCIGCEIHDNLVYLRGVSKNPGKIRSEQRTELDQAGRVARTSLRASSTPAEACRLPGSFHPDG